jgi:hypothetical protein
MSKVLVLCQRRKGIGNELDSINENIEQFATQLLGDTDIKYVSPRTNARGVIVPELSGEADMEFVFGNNKETNALANDYSLIICNTCPAFYMNYTIIHQHLKDNGYLAITAYEPYNNQIHTTKSLHAFLVNNGALAKILASGFIQVDTPLDTLCILFQKITMQHIPVEYETSDYDQRDPGYIQPSEDLCWLPPNKCEKTSRTDKKLLELLKHAQNEPITPVQSKPYQETPTIEDDDLYSGGSRRKQSKKKRKYRKKSRRKQKKSINI